MKLVKTVEGDKYFTFPRGENSPLPMLPGCTVIRASRRLFNCHRSQELCPYLTLDIAKRGLQSFPPPAG